jgi:hypothetical protein
LTAVQLSQGFSDSDFTRARLGEPNIKMWSAPRRWDYQEQAMKSGATGNSKKIK